MQQLIKRIRINPAQRFIPADQVFFCHFNRHAQRCLGGAFAVAGLQHIELALLDSKFQILHVAVMRFKPATHIIKLGKYIGHGFLH